MFVIAYSSDIFDCRSNSIMLPEKDITEFFTFQKFTTMQNGLITRENLNQTSVVEIFSNAFFDVQESNGDHSIVDNYRIWLTADPKGRYVKFDTVFRTDPKAKEHEILRAVNKLNADYILFKMFMGEGYVEFQYYLWVEGGVAPKAIVQAYKIFSSVLPDLVKELADQSVIH